MSEYLKLKEEFKDYPLFTIFKNGRGEESFYFWDGKSYYSPPKSRSTGRGHKAVYVICSSCLKDENPDVKYLVSDFKFLSTTYRIAEGTNPCGCSKTRGKTLLQHYGVDDFIGRVKSNNRGCNTVVSYHSGKGNSRKYLLHCEICSEDKELFPLGITVTRSNFEKSNNLHCGCSNKGRYWSEDQVKTKCVRISQIKDLVFQGWVGDVYKGTNKTFLKLYCPVHGLSTNTRTDKYLIYEGGCRDCSQELGVWGFYKSRLQERDYLYMLEVSNEGESFIKIGRSFDPKMRLKQHKSLSSYNFKTLSLVSDTHFNIYYLEVHLKTSKRDYRYLPENPWQGSYTECFTKEILSHPEIISTFNLK